MRRAVEGRVNSDFLEITLPLLKVVVVTLATVALVSALRALGLRALGAVDLGAVAVLGINALRVYSFIIQKKRLTRTPL